MPPVREKPLTPEPLLPGSRATNPAPGEAGPRVLPPVVRANWYWSARCADALSGEAGVVGIATEVVEGIAAERAHELAGVLQGRRSLGRAPAALPKTMALHADRFLVVAAVHRALGGVVLVGVLLEAAAVAEGVLGAGRRSEAGEQDERRNGGSHRTIHEGTRSKYKQHRFLNQALSTIASEYIAR